MKNELISNIDQVNSRVIVYQPDSFEKILVFVHGMQDHIDRYHGFAKTLQSHNIMVCLFDLRGHGQSDHLGHFSDQQGWLKQIQDINQLVNELKREFDKEVILYGHSMGSIFVQSTLKRYPHLVDKFILSGPPANNPLSKVVLPVLKTIPFKKHRSILIHKVMISEFNKPLKNPRTSFDWLSYNHKNVDDYMESDYCGFPFSIKGMEDLFLLMLDSQKVEFKGKNILILSGIDDTVALKQPYQLDEKFKSYNNVQLIIYSQARHEILFESCKEKVHQDIVDFITY